MLGKVKRWLVGHPVDPTEGWPVVEGNTPSLDLFRRAVGPVAFGAPLADAQAFGRPQRLRWPNPGYCELLYARAGFQLDFDGGHLAYAAFFLGPDELLPDGARFCTARLSTGLALSGVSTLADVQAALGAPLSRDEGEEERVVTYELERLTLELEADARGRLKRLNVFPSGQGGP
jgi:hypothetical protein